MQEPLIQKILNLAKYTFARQPSSKSGVRQRILEPDAFSTHVLELVNLVKEVPLTDMGLQFSPSLFPNMYQTYLKKTESHHAIEDKLLDSKPPLETLEKADVTYIPVYENCDISVGIFIVRGKSGLPLHNHPGMHGILKVIHGTLSMSCYDKIPQLSLSQQRVIPSALRNRLDLIDRGFFVPVSTVFSGSSVTSTSSPTVLCPDNGNFHTICNESEDTAAFIDILSPPYNHKGFELSMEGDSVVRECEYFKEITFQSDPAEEIDQTIKWLKMIPTPSDFTCDSERYLGPTIEP